MNSRLLISLAVGLAAIAVAVIFWHGKQDPAPPATKAISKPLSAESELEQSLKTADPNEEQLQREIALLQQMSKEAGESPRPRNNKNLLKPAPLDRDYDLQALNDKLVAALEGTDTDERRRILREVAAFLAKEADVEIAKHYLNSILSTRDQFTDSDLYAFTTTFVGDLSKVNPAAAAAWTENLSDRLKFPTQQLVVRNWAPQSPEAVDQWSQTIENEALRASALKMMSQILAVSDPDYATQWALRLAENQEDGPRLSEVVVAHWGQVDFNAALEWTNNLELEDDRTDGVLALVKSTAYSDPAGTAEWVNENLEDSVRSAALSHTMAAWTRKDPPAAARWLDQLGDAEAVRAHFETVAVAWMKKDPTAAESWIDSAAVNQERKDYVHQVSD